MEIVVNLAMLGALSVSRAGELAASLAAVLIALGAGYVGWGLTDRLMAWRQNAD